MQLEEMACGFTSYINQQYSKSLNDSFSFIFNLALDMNAMMRNNLKHWFTQITKTCLLSYLSWYPSRPIALIRFNLPRFGQYSGGEQEFALHRNMTLFEQHLFPETSSCLLWIIFSQFAIIRNPSVTQLQSHFHTTIV